MVIKEWHFKPAKQPSVYVLMISTLLCALTIIWSWIAHHYLIVLMFMVLLVVVYYWHREQYKIYQYGLQKKEFLRLETNCIHYNIYPHGEGSLQYQSLTYARPSPYPKRKPATRADGLVLQYRPDTHTQLSPTLHLSLVRMIRDDDKWLKFHSEIVIEHLEQTCERKLFV